MDNFSKLKQSLSTITSDSHIAAALHDFFSQLAPIADTYRFRAMEPHASSRHYLIVFTNPIDANKLAQQLNLKTFAYDSILVELN